jgi:hypothetical protein
MSDFIQKWKVSFKFTKCLYAYMNVRDNDNPFSSSELQGAQSDGLTWQSYQAKFCNFSMSTRQNLRKRTIQKVEKKHTKIGGIKQKSIDLDQFLRTYVLGLHFPLTQNVSLN